MSTAENSTAEPIAIVGMSCRFPGAQDPDALWKMVAERRESVAEYPGGRTPELDAFYRRAGMPDGPASSRGGFLPDIEYFDASFFEISPREAEWLDPQQRLLLEATWDALEDAGIPLPVLAKEKTGVFVGAWLSEYEHHTKANAPLAELFLITGGPLYGTSSRISFHFDLRGADFAVNAACGSSLVALHLANRSLRSGECSVALVGGVNVQVRHECTQAFSRAKMLSPDGRCKFGAANADGFVRSDGVAVLVLKKLSAAQRDGDRVLALIRGTGMANDGRGSGFLATPSASGQRAAMLAAVEDAGIDPKTVDYVEAHGTGTRAGDPIELSAISSVFGRPGPDGNPCHTASVKSNIGHTESAAGVASVIRVVKALQNQQLPASLHAGDLNPAIDWEKLGIRLDREGGRWERNADTPRRASVNGLSLTGTNAHIILEEAQEDLSISKRGNGPYVLTISASSENSLRQRMMDFADQLSDLSEHGLENSRLYDFCYTAAARRTHLSHRRAVVGSGAKEIKYQLAVALGGEESSFTFAGVVEGNRSPKIAFVFPGQGSQWVGMGRELLRDKPVFREVMQQLDAAIKSETGWSVLQQLEDAALDERLTRIDVIQPTLFAIEVALAGLWRSWGVTPNAVIGHSMGEIAAACVAGILSYKDAAAIICRRSALLMRVAGTGAMVVVDLTRDEAQRRISGNEGKVSVAVSNSARSTVLAGDPSVLDGIVQQLEVEDIFCRWVRVDVASHSPQMDPLKNDLLSALEQIKPLPGDIPLCSTVIPGMVEASAMNAGYWVSNLREPVLFGRAVEELVQQGFDTFIEMSPHPILVPFIEQTAEMVGRKVLVTGSLRREEPEVAALMRSAAQLYVVGTELDWKSIYPVGHLTKLPAYPWQRERFWIDSNGATSNGFLSRNGHPLLGEPLVTATSEYIWTSSISTEVHPWLRDHGVGGTVLLPGSAYVEMAAAAGERILEGAVALEQLVLLEAAPLREGNPLEIQMVASLEAPREFALQFFIRQSETEGWTKTAECLIRSAQKLGEDSESLTEWDDAEFAPTTLLGSQHVNKMADIGYEFGPTFCQIDWISLNRSSAVAKIVFPSQMLREGYRVHPATLDAALQVVGHLLIEKSEQTLLPVSIKTVEWSEVELGGDSLYVRARANPSKLSGDVEALNSRGQKVFVIRELVFSPFVSREATGIEDALFEMAWWPLDIARVVSPLPPLHRWLLIGGDSSESTSLSCAFESKGVITNVMTVDHFLSDAFDASISYRGAVWLDPLTLEAFSSLSRIQDVLADGAQVATKMSGLTENPPRLWTMTRDTQAVTGEEAINVSASGVWGFFSVVSNEYPSLRASLIDTSFNSKQQDVVVLTAVLLGDVQDYRVALRSAKLYTQRLVQSHMLESMRTDRHDLLREDEGFRLVQRVPGTLNSLELVSKPLSAPAYGEVEIEVEAGGLNFVDVLRAMALHKDLSGNHLGGECAGRVVRVGCGVTKFKEGDEVLAISPTFENDGMFASRTIVPEILASAKPNTMSFTEAAGIPCVFLTAWYGLVKLAKLERGERVLIHAAAGGVGLAAIQIAKWIGAEIFVTVGSDTKRAYMERLGVKHVMHSRKLDFSREVMEITDGQGVDVVLNSLSGPAISAGLATLAHYGRFVEIGKRDILEDSRIGLRAFYRNRSMFAVDLAQAVEDRREMVGTMFGEVMELFERGVFSPLPVEVFSISVANEAFRHMAQGAHIGKVVLTMKGDSTCVRRDRTRLNPNATYLITGGVGGLGLVTARTFVENGARHLVLASRHGGGLESASALQKLAIEGATVVVRKVDLNVEDDVGTLLQEIRSSMPPLRGIVHAAGVLDDVVVSGLSRARFENVMGGKVSGAFSLDLLIERGELDFLVYYSSVAGLLGSPGQGNYAAANTMLDALAHAQRARGIPAISINWGSWSEVGLAAARDNRGERLANQGVTPLKPKDGADLLMRIIGGAPVQISAMHFDANLWCAAQPGAGPSGLFSSLAGQRTGVTQGENDFAASIQHLSEEALRVALVQWLRSQLAVVLRLDLARISADKPMRSLGLDSLMALEMRNRLERALHLKLSATLVWNYPTVSALAGYLEGRLMAIHHTVSEKDSEVVSTPNKDHVVFPLLKEDRDRDVNPNNSAADLLEAELLGAEDLLNTLENAG